MVKQGYKQTEIGVIPEDWSVLKLQDCASFLDHKRIPIKDSDRKKMRGPYPYYGASGIIDYVDNYIFDGTYILLGEDGANIIDRSSRLAFIVNGKCWINNHAHVILPTPSMDIYFLSEYLESIKYDEYNTGTAQPKLNREKCNGIPIAVPSLEEQKRIAEALSDVDGMISSLEKLIAKKKAVKQGAMQELLTGKKRLPGFDGEWKIYKLDEIAKIIMGQSPDSKFYNVSEGMPLIQGNADISNKKTQVRFYTTQITKTAFAGDIIFTVRAPVGNVAKTSFDCCIGRGVCALRGSTDFLFHYLIYIEPYWATLSAGSTFDSINSNTLANTELLIPLDVEEQNAIASILSDMDNEIEALEHKLEKTRQIKQGMMQQLLTGKIRLV